MVALVVSLVLFPPQSAAVGQSLLNSSYQKVLKARSVSFELKVPGAPSSPMQMKFAMLRGGYMRMTMPTAEMIYAPKAGYMVMSDQKKYMKMPEAAMKAASGAISMPGLEGFQSGGKPLKASTEPSLVTIDGKKAYKVGLAGGDSPMMMAFKGASILIDAQSVLPVGLEMNQNGQKITLGYGEMKVDTLTESDFDWTPPTDWQEMSSPMGAAVGAAQTDSAPVEDEYSAKLLKVGSKAPDFAAKTPAGATTKLSTLMKGRKATLVNFWFYG